MIHRIQQRYPAPVADTVDTVKARVRTTPVTGIATTFLDTMEVLREANRRGLNLVITHEPTFYNHRDDTTFFSSDPVYQDKLAFIEQHHMVVFRLHDEIHGTAPDHIAQGLIEALGWQSYTKPDDPFHATIPPSQPCRSGEADTDQAESEYFASGGRSEARDYARGPCARSLRAWRSK